MAWPLDRKVYGPERPTLRDVEPLNRVFADAFTDRYRRDGLVGVRVPHLNPVIWRYALEDAGEGAMVWRDDEGQLLAFNIAHYSGTEGWMGPLAVRPDHQNSGLGKAMLRSGIEWLRSRRVQTIGLETMPRTVENIGFYSRLGFVPGFLTVTLTRDLSRRGVALPELLSSAGARRGARVEECRELTDRLCPGTDFSREITLTEELNIGDTVMYREGNVLRGYALWHSAPLATGRAREEVRVLKLVAADSQAFKGTVAAVESAALSEGIRRISVRAQTSYPEPYRWLIGQGFRAHWTDLRMTLEGHPEVMAERGVVWSNWEI